MSINVRSETLLQILPPVPGEKLPDENVTTTRTEMRQFTERILFWENCRPNFGKVAERNLEKLPNENWKNCRTGIVSFRDV